MKKAVFMMAITLLFAASSCKKDYTCTCTDTYPGLTITNQSKSDAEAACAVQQTHAQQVKSSTTCSI